MLLLMSKTWATKSTKLSIHVTALPWLLQTKKLSSVEFILISLFSMFRDQLRLQNDGWAKLKLINIHCTFKCFSIHCKVCAALFGVTLYYCVTYGFLKRTVAQSRHISRHIFFQKCFDGFQTGVCTGISDNNRDWLHALHSCPYMLHTWFYWATFISQSVSNRDCLLFLLEIILRPKVLSLLFGNGYQVGRWLNTSGYMLARSVIGRLKVCASFAPFASLTVCH